MNLFSHPLNMLERFILQCVYFKPVFASSVFVAVIGILLTLFVH